MKTTHLLSIFIIFLFTAESSIAQLVIKEIDAVYVSNEDGRIISKDEFQSYKGVYTLNKRIKTTTGKDTFYITPPNNHVEKEKARREALQGQIGEKIKDFYVTDIFGNSFNTQELENKIIVINFFFVACPPCVKEIPELNKLVEMYDDQVLFLAFALDSKEQLGRFLSHTPFEYAIIPDSKSIAKEFKVSFYPTHFIIGKKGIVNYIMEGYSENSIEEIKKNIDQNLQ